MRLITLPNSWTVLVDCVLWALAGTAIGFAAHRAGPDSFDRDGWLTRLRRFERDGRWYERRLHIKAWKQIVPEAGTLFGVGFSKRRLTSSSIDHLRRFVVETRRAEITHWLVLAVGPLFVLWNPVGLAIVMCAYAVLANGPCIAIQRYNRGRLARVIRRTDRLRKSTGGA
jgi:glycosyl-4,4'-diaponeurosporenoate acyltransferase